MKSIVLLLLPTVMKTCTLIMDICTLVASHELTTEGGKVAPITLLQSSVMG